MDFEPSPKSRDYRDRVRAFVDKHVLPMEYAPGFRERLEQYGGDWTKWQPIPELEKLKELAKAEGLWNLWMPDATLGAGLTTLEYAPVAEATGRSLWAPEVFNCSAPDTGNMEVLWRYGTPEHQEKWLKPLLAGEIRSVFGMTEPDVASSDATNMQASARQDGDEWVITGKKWWTSGLGDPRAKIGIVMVRTAGDDAPRHARHSMILVPLDSPGLSIKRMLSVFGNYDAPHGHGEMHFDGVRVPASNILLGPGRGFEIAQGRLGPGRIHHCMRCIGAAEESLRLAVERGLSRTAFGKPLIDLGGNRERVADARIAIEQARLLTLHAAWKLDQKGALNSLADIAAIKVVAPNVLQQVVDFAIQIHGGQGVSADTPLAGFYAQGRTIRLADGPDEVHRGLVAKLEIARAGRQMAGSGAGAGAGGKA